MIYYITTLFTYIYLYLPIFTYIYLSVPNLCRAKGEASDKADQEDLVDLPDALPGENRECCAGHSTLC